MKIKENPRMFKNLPNLLELFVKIIIIFWKITIFIKDSIFTLNIMNTNTYGRITTANVAIFLDLIIVSTAGVFFELTINSLRWNVDRIT